MSRSQMSTDRPISDSPYLLEARDLAVSFRSSAGSTDAVTGVSFNIKKGQAVAIVGESGSGKSVTALSLMQLLPYPTAYHPSGSILYQGQELMNAPEEQMHSYRGNRISMIFQEPLTSLNPLHTVVRQISETLIIHKSMSKAEATERTLELLNLVQIQKAEERLHSFPHQLSGGQCQRVMIAMALANEPSLLIADEPTTALDVTTQAQILKLLKDLQDKLGMALLLISHDLNIVRKMADDIYVMHVGKFVESGSREAVFGSPQHDYTRMLLSSEPSGSSGLPEKGAPVVMDTESLRVWYPVRRGVLRRVVDYIKAVDDVSVTIREGETIGLVGESGSGKTSFAMAILRLISSRGRIRFEGREIQGSLSKEIRDLRSRMQIVFQDPFGSLNPRMTVEDIIAEGLWVHHPDLTQEDCEQQVVEVLQEVGLSVDMRYRYPHEFSGGQRQRIAIARAMILKPRLVILDEPTSALDRSVQSQIIELLRNLQRKHALAYIFISHDLSVVRAMSSVVVVLRGGRVVEQGETESIYQNPKNPYTKALISAAMNLEMDFELEKVVT